MSDTQRKVPELSLLSYVNGTQSEQDKFVSDLYNGIKDYGFIILTDHTVEESVIEKGYKAVEDFFALPEATKKSYVCKEGGGQRGYTPFGTEHAKDNPHKDLKEFWHVGRQVPAEHKFRKYYPDNVWPKTSEVTGFEPNLQNLFDELDKTSQILLEALGKALKVPQSYFDDMIDTGNSILRAIHYPPVGEAPPAGSVRAAAHGDINLITILMGATASGLQLLDKDDTWLDVDTKPGQLVVDSGDMMSRITNEVIPATIHRVINPEESNTARFSMPFFVHPHPEAMLTCIPSCKGDGEKFPPISAHDSLMERLKDIGLM
jgi:isopenicillin N synthase-like dioxygenase